MKIKLPIILSALMLFGLSSCSNVSKIGNSAVKCGDEGSLQLIETLLKDNTQSRVKNIASNEGLLTDGADLRASTSQIDFSLTDVRTSKTDPNSTKVFCVAALTTTLDSETIDRANFVTDYYEQSNLNEEAFQQDIDMDGNAIQYSLEYSIQPTDDGANIYGELQNGSELIDFIGTAIVNATQKNEVQAMKARQQKANVENAIAERVALEEEQEVMAQAEQAAYREAASERAAAIAELAKAKTALKYKRNEFNELWKTASAETQENLAEAQKEWVKERNETCDERAHSVEYERLEIVWIECTIEMLDTRYYEIRNYINEYG